jgi:hypothetical protein
LLRNIVWNIDRNIVRNLATLTSAMVAIVNPPLIKPIIRAEQASKKKRTGIAAGPLLSCDPGEG